MSRAPRYACGQCRRIVARGLYRELGGIATFVCRPCGRKLPKAKKRGGSAHLFRDL